MTENEAIEWQKAFKKTYKGFPKDVDVACDIAIKALEKQIPKKPVINYKNTSDDVTEIEYTCSVCGTNFVELTPCKEWCPYCGNMFDWSDA